MNIEKIRNLGPDELLKDERDAADQLFRLKFQLKMGQTTGVKKMRELRKDLARIKTIARERELGIVQSHVADATGAAAAAPARPGVRPASGEAAPATGSRKSAASKASPGGKTAANKKVSAAPKKAAAKNAK